MKKDNIVEKGILWIITVSFFAVYIGLSFSHNIWTDEAFTVELLKRDISGIIQGTAIDVHPPLYYIIAKIFITLLPNTRFVLKLVSIVPMMIMMIVGSRMIEKLFSIRAAILYVLTIGSIPCVTEYVTQLRMYSWAMCFITFMALNSYAWYIEDNMFYLMWIVICAVSAAYTHYFAFASALWIYGFLFLSIAITKRKLLAKWLVAVVISGLAYLPWVAALASQLGSVSEDYWIENITWKTVKEFLPFLFKTDVPGSDVIWVAIILISVVAVVIHSGTDKSNLIFILLCIAVPICTTITGVVASYIIRPVFIIRYTVPCMGLVAIAIAIGIDSLIPRDKAQKTAIVFTALFFIMSFLTVIRNGYWLEYKWCKTYDTERFFSENLGEDDVIAYNYSKYDFVYACYWDEEKLVDIQDLDLENCDYDNIWFLNTIYWPEITDEQLDTVGYTSEYMGNYGVEHNDFKIFRIYKK